MSEKLIPLKNIVDVDKAYEESIRELEERVEERDIPSWILVPKRSAGENPTGYAWLGVVMSECGDEGDGVIETRVAVDTEDRHRAQSNVGNVPEAILDTIADATQVVDEDVDICVAHMEYDKSSMELQSIELHLRTKEEEIAEE